MKVDGQLLNDLREAFASGPARQFPYPLRNEPATAADAPPRLLPIREAKARNLRLPGRATALFALLTFS